MHKVSIDTRQLTNNQRLELEQRLTAVDPMFPMLAFGTTNWAVDDKKMAVLKRYSDEINTEFYQEWDENHHLI